MKSLSENNQKLKKFAVIDFEASKWVNYLCNGLYDGENYYEFTELKKCFDFLHTFETKTIFAHFGGIYDFLFIIGYVLDSNDFSLVDLIPRGSSILTFRIRSNINNTVITFCDSSALLPFSLRSIALNFKVETLKGEIDYDSLESVTPELLEYMKDDHLALHQSLSRFFEWDLIAKHGWKQTLASQALHIFRKEFYPDKLKSLSKALDPFVRKSYLGGRTEIFNLVYDNPKKLLNCYDVNSLYPTVMLENDYPSEFDYWTDEFEKGKLGFYHCKVKCPKNMKIPILGAKLKVNEKSPEAFIFPTGEFSGYWTEHELSYALDNGYKILEIYKGAVFKNDGRIFKHYVEYFYEKRKNSDSSVDNIICKLLLNSLYGRFGMDTEKDQLHLEKRIEGEKYHSTVKTPTGKEFRFFTSSTEIETFSNVAVSSYVTSYGRVKMHKFIKQLKNDVYYMDTDSLFTPKKLKQGKNLGDMKLEYSIQRAVFLLPKTYLVESNDFKKITMKGFDKKKIQHFSYNDFTNALEGDIKLKNKNDKNTLKIEVDSKMNKFKTAIKKGELLSMSKKSTKKINSKYNKRRVNKDFSTKPIHIMQ